MESLVFKIERTEKEQKMYIEYTSLMNLLERYSKSWSDYSLTLYEDDSELSRKFVDMSVAVDQVEFEILRQNSLFLTLIKN